MERSESRQVKYTKNGIYIAQCYQNYINTRSRLTNINEEGRVSLMSKLNIFNVGKKAAWVESLYASGYKNVNLEEIKPLFDYLDRNIR